MPSRGTGVYRLHNPGGRTDTAKMAIEQIDGSPHLIYEVHTSTPYVGGNAARKDQLCT
jgi:hypothetical protein